MGYASSMTRIDYVLDRTIELFHIYPTQPEISMKQATSTEKIQGEGDYEANRRYTESASAFAKSGKVAEAARKAEPVTESEKQELQRAERVGAAHSKGEDPAPQHAPALKP